MKTPEQQQITIAEKCGWHSFEKHNGNLFGVNLDKSKSGKLIVPDYLKDIKAMREVEATMTDLQFKEYRRELWHITVYESSGSTDKDNRAFFSATAAQRAEAFLKVSEKLKP